MLADLVLRNRAAWRVLGDWETKLLGRQLAGVQIDRPVFIAGVARAGTTMLLRKICELPGFASHRYADFPFLFTPYAWSKLRSLMPARGEAPRERMHKDGIMVTSESPEAMEEVLWTAFFPDLHDPGRTNLLDEHTTRPVFEAFFAEHIRKLILARGAQRYVSKNNYNLTRLRYLARIFADARFLIPVRDPFAHVASLMKQQELFCRVQRQNKAVRQQLSLRAHFEFGLDRRPINPGDADAIAAIEDCWKHGEEARGWAKYWTLLYTHAISRLGSTPELARRCMLVRYEDLCDRSVETVSEISEHLGLPATKMRHLAVGLHQPAYYQPKFNDEEREAIAEETSALARRLGYEGDLVARTRAVAPGTDPS